VAATLAVELHRLELGLARRKMEFYERTLADELAGKYTGTDIDQTRGDIQTSV
jgi:hypothetical protein